MDSKSLSSTIVNFSAKFCNELNKDKNVVCSPLSAEFVLALLSLGTTGPTRFEILSSLGIPWYRSDDIRSSFTTVSSKLKAVKGVTLNVANKVYLKDGCYELVPELKDDAVKVFDAEIEKVNFNNGAVAADIINKWVESKTNNKIQKLFSPDSLNSDTRLVLVNAVYFKGNWKKQFNADKTSDRPFFVKNDVTINVPMMFLRDDYKYGQSKFLQAKLLEMPYVGDEASMLMVLPDEIEGLDGVLQKLANGYNLLEEVDRMFSTTVIVYVPKFKIETKIDLGDMLPKLGIKAIFDKHNSGLTKLLDNNESLYVSEAVQKAFIEVNEGGTEAAAATSHRMTSKKGGRTRPPRFHADRPFLYVLAGPEHIPYFIGIYRGSC